MAATDPHPQKPKPDDGDKDEAETKETLESDHEEAVYSDDEELLKTLCPGDFTSGELFKLCELALVYYEFEHPGEYFTFESGRGGRAWLRLLSTQYDLGFYARKSSDDNSTRYYFEACTRYLNIPHVRPEEFRVHKCFRLQDGEEEPRTDVMIEDMEKKRCAKIVLLGNLSKQEKKEIVVFCKSALTHYNDSMGESYKFVKMQQVRRWIYRAVEYILVFHAKKGANAIPSIFKAYASYFVPAVEIMSCQRREI